MAEVGSRCGCKGIRTCLLCEQQSESAPLISHRVCHVIYQCHRCGRVLPEGGGLQPDPDAPPLFSCEEPCIRTGILRAWDDNLYDRSDDGPIRFEGVTVIKEFVSPDEEQRITQSVDRWKWAESQSGRRKQDFGPKVNFKRRKLKLGGFNGLPSFSQLLVERMRSTADGELRDFVPVELCNLEYVPERGSAIDPHRDNSWVWGERLVTLTLLSHTALTFSTPSHTTDIHIALPQRSLVIVRGLARHHWLHSVKRQNIVSRRLAVTLRELSGEFLSGGREEEMGKRVVDAAMCFGGQPTN